MKLRNGRDVLILDEMIINSQREYSKYLKECVYTCIRDNNSSKKKYLLTYIEFIYLHCIDNWLLHIPIPSYEEFNDFHDNIYVAGLRAIIDYVIEHGLYETNTKISPKTRREILINTVLETQKQY